MVFPVPGRGLCSEVARRSAGPIADPSQGIGKAADDQHVREMLQEQDAFLTDILCEGPHGQ